MMKLLFGFLLLSCIALFSYLKWGAILTGAGKNGISLGDLNSEKIKLLEMPAVNPASVMPKLSAQSAVAASAPINTSSELAVLPASAPVPSVAPKLIPQAPSAALVASADKKDAVVCVEWGEFSGPYVEKAKKVLESMKLGERLTQRTVEYETGYRVYIPPLPNKAAIRKKIAEIKASGLEEYYVVRHQGKLNNSISLGIFKSEDAAKRFLVIVRKKGFRAEILGEHKQKLKLVVFVMKELNKENVAHLAKLQKDFANSELNKLECKK